MTYSSEVLADAPVAYWPLDESSGSFGDDSGNGKTLAWASGGAGTQGDAGPFSGALAAGLNGSSNRLESNLSFASATDITVELWYKGTDTQGVLASARGSGTRSITLLMGYSPTGGAAGGQLILGVSGDSLWNGVSVQAFVNDNVWHHIVAVWDGTTGVGITAPQFRVFVDGVNYPTSPLSAAGGVAAPLVSGTYMFGHSTFDSAAGYLSGSLAQIAVYPTPLTITRARAHFTAGGGVLASRPSPTPTGALSQAILDRTPLAYYRLGEAAGGVIAYDSTMAERDGGWVGSATRGVASLTPSEPTNTATDFSGGRASINYESWMGIDYVSAFARIKPDTISGNDTVACQDFNGSAGELAWRLRLANGKVEGIVRTAGGVYTASGATTLTAGQTYSIAMTYDGVNVKVYLNGAVDGTLALTGVLSRSSQGLHLGSLGATSEPFDGVIDEVAIWSTGLTSSDMTALHAAAIASPSTNTNVSMTGTFDLAGSVAIELATLVDLAGVMDFGGVFNLEALTPLEIELVGDTAFSGFFDLGAAAVDLIGTLPDLAGSFSVGSMEFSTILGGALPPFVGDFRLPLVVSGGVSHVDVHVEPGYVSVTSALSLVILDPTQDRAPTSVQVTVGGADPGAELVFDIDGVEVWTDFADANGYLGHTAIPVPVGTTAGTRVLTVTSASNGSDSEDFTLRRGTSIYPVTQSVDVDPVFIPGSEGRWVLQDVMPGGLGSWLMPVNPKTMTSPHVEKSIEVTHTTAPSSGRYHLAGAAKTAKPWELAGYVPDQTFRDQLKAYAELKRRIYVIDHRGRAWVCAVRACKIEPRKRQVDSVSDQNDHAGNWTMSLMILDQTWVVPA